MRIVVMGCYLSGGGLALIGALHHFSSRELSDGFIDYLIFAFAVWRACCVSAKKEAE